MLHNYASRSLIKLGIKVPGLHVALSQRHNSRHELPVRDAPTTLPIRPDMARRADLGSALLLCFLLALAPTAQGRYRPILGHSPTYANRLPFDKRPYEIKALGVSAEILHFHGMDDAPNRIRELRLARSWSQQRLADSIGVTKMTISDLERGEMQLTQHYMRRLALALDCTAADILPAADNPYHLSSAERELIDRMRAAEDTQRQQLHQLADVVIPWRGPVRESDAA